MWPGRGHVRDPEYVFQEQKKGIKPMEANNENPIIQLVGLGKQFQTMNGPVTALEDINLEIRYGEVFGIIGLSGAGKSTLVRCINYLEVPTSGKVVFEGKNLSVMKDREKRLARQSMGMIFQQFNLLAQRNVIQNVCFPLEIAGAPKKEARERAMELLGLVGLADRKDAYPSQLSGGQKQRVAIARAYAVQPEVLLMDEPFGALDAQTRTQLQSELIKTWQGEKKTCFFITPDVEEAVILATKVIIMSARPGRIKKIVDINLPYPRTQEMKMELPFLDLKTYIWGEVYKEYLEVRK